MTFQNGPRGGLSRFELLPIVGYRLVLLVRFSETVLISLNLYIFSKLGIGPKYEPIRTIHKGTTSQIILSNGVAQNKQNLSIWLCNIRQSAKFGQTDHSNGWRSQNYEPMGMLERGTTYWINWSNGITWNGWSSQNKFGRWVNWFWTFQSNRS